MASVMDGDYPITRRQVKLLVVGLAVMAVAGGALFGGFLPGLHPTFGSDLITLQGHQFYEQSTPLHVPFLVNTSSPWNVSYRNVTFQFWLTNWYSVSGGVVHGIGTEVNGSSHGFVLGIASLNGSRQTLYLAPDFDWGVWWAGGLLGGFSVTLLVKV
jgi:hypothetical protein